MVKRILCLMLALLFVVTPLAACEGQTGDEKDSESETLGVTDAPVIDAPESDAQESESQETEGEEGDPTMALTESGIILTDEFSFVARSDKDKLRKETTITRVSELDDKYLSTEGNMTFVSIDAPLFEIGGGYINDSGKLVRYAADASKSEFATDTAGVTIRFATSAAAMTIKASVTGAYNTNNTVARGSYGFDVYVGSGTDRTEQGSHLQRMTNVSLNEKVDLPGGFTEVLIYLPQLASLRSLKIGFDSPNSRVGLPLARDYAPIVFYGSGITQGLSSARGGSNYTSIVSRMLNTDVINLGMVDGAHGEKEMAEYIASLESISAFVMEFDHGATLDELKANHYTFYKTVRDAHPDIPIIIMTDLVFSEADRAERGERVAVITETYNKALKAGDANVWLLDGDDVFPTEDLLDLYTSELETPSDLGHFYLATCVYDVLNSAFTPDEGKSGVKREVGFKDSFEYELHSDDDKIMEGEYVKVSSLDSKLVNSKNDGYNFLTLSTPQLELGGLIHPDDNEGQFYRVPYSRREEFLDNLEPDSRGAFTSLLNHTTGGTIRFRTNADSIVIKAKLEYTSIGGTHISNMGSSGIEVYVGSGNDRVYCEDRGQAIVGTGVLTETVKLPEGYKEVLISLPNYSGVEYIYVGLPEGAEIAAPLERDYAPILYYGTSITQGACASRSMLGFANTTARLLNTDLIHLGFSGSGRGEPIMREWLASYADEVSVFVMNYDANSGVDEMAERCYPVYKAVRDANPDLPIIMMTCPYFNDVRTWFREECYKIMKKTYDRAVAEGDKNVYFLDCRDNFPEELTTLRDIGVVDQCHLTDVGMYYTAREIYAVLCDILKK